jgi:hypothetical protein
MARALAVAARVIEEVDRMLVLAEPARHHRAYDECETLDPSRRRSRRSRGTPGAPRGPLRPGLRARPRRTRPRPVTCPRPTVHRPARQREGTRGQTPGLVQPSSQESSKRGRTAQPRPACGVAEFGEEPGRASQGRIGGGEVTKRGSDPRQVLAAPTPRRGGPPEASAMVSACTETADRASGSRPRR